MSKARCCRRPEFARLAVAHGTVGTVSDPHEIANVLGVAGVDYMLEEAAKSPFKFCFGRRRACRRPRGETAGATLGPRAVAGLLARKEIGYLSEFMNFPAVLRRSKDAMAKIKSALAKGKPVDGPRSRPEGRGGAALRLGGDHDRPRVLHPRGGPGQDQGGHEDPDSGRLGGTQFRRPGPRC